MRKLTSVFLFVIFLAFGITNIRAQENLDKKMSPKYRWASALATSQRGDYTPSLSEGLFENRTSLEHITLPSNVVLLKQRAFKNCTQLKEVVLSPQINQTFESDLFPDQEHLTLYVPTEEIKKQLESQFHFAKTRILVGKPDGVLVPNSIPTAHISVSPGTLQIEVNQSVEVCLYDLSGAIIDRVACIAGENKSWSLPAGSYLLSIHKEPFKVLVP